MTAYRPNRNIVRRRLDGRAVNVARARGQIFVCADACCCGRTDLTNRPVPTERYHAEWTRRRLRNFVHLTIGGCLGPCALANVAMLLIDGRSLWFHSMNDEADVVLLFDYIESMLNRGAFEMPSGVLAELTFTGYQWQERPDGLPLDGARTWRGRANRPDPTPICEMSDAGRSLADAWEHGEGAPGAGPLSGAMHGTEAPPRANGELVFGSPWEGRVFAMAASLADDGVYDWNAFRRRLVAEIAGSERSGEAADYYVNWLRAFEALLLDEGLVTADELAERTAELEFGERVESF